MSAPRAPSLARLHDLGPLEPLVGAIAERVAEIVLERLGDRLGAPTAELLTKQQLAVALSISVATLDRYIRGGLIVATVRLGGSDGPQRFDLAQVRAALESATKPSAPAHIVADAAPRLLKRGPR